MDVFYTCTETQTSGTTCFFFLCIGGLQSAPPVLDRCKCSQARTESTNVKADQRGRGEEEVIVLGQGMKQLCLM